MYQDVPKNTKMNQKIKPKYFILRNSTFFYADISVTSVTNCKSACNWPMPIGQLLVDAEFSKLANDDTLSDKSK